ncbi:MAG: GNAT family N-acetyltransferase [Streptococcus sp.]|uniref:GNAT family N-acetyltransferase n=1 Tax=Streptococcus TaxID=1301 RepID=UPI0006609B63|nr:MULTISPECIES: GNAT family N-acetyltransferase [unclassified Streptococcus]MBS4897404.1 GNAT family N-acetyltransferase [Streptococcus sp.]MCF4964494.1 GNAT family N-acetyltransferase [Streptococcus sp. GS001]
MELFKTWKKNMVLYGLKSQIGTVYRNSDGTTSFYDIGNFLYLAGELNSRFWEDFIRQYGLDYKIIISEDTKWQDFMRRQVGLISFTRYSFKDKANFQVEFLNDLVSQLEKGYNIVPIDNHIYNCLSEDEWSQDLQGDFESYQNFTLKGGFGFVIVKNKELIAGISSGLVYQGAVEVEVATRPNEQGNGFAKKLGATMILESLNRDTFPLWDAHNVASKKVAEFLGYELVGPYEAFELEESVV